MPHDELSESCPPPERAEKAHRAAAVAALKNLRAEAAEAAAALGMQVDRYQSVRLDGRPGIMPFPAARMNAAVAMAPAMAPPNATPEQQDITAEVHADVVLGTAPAQASPPR